jgi:hypothetical protein
MGTEGDIYRALWLMRLSYLRYALKKAADAGELLEQESKRLQLNQTFKSLLRQFLPATVRQSSTQSHKMHRGQSSVVGR